MRHRWTLIVAAAGLLATSGCDNAFGIGHDQLVGTWRVSNTEAYGIRDYRIVFTSKGGFSVEGRMYGLYPGQTAYDLSAYFRVQGTYRADDGQLDMTTRKLTTWDRFHGPASPEQVQEPYSDPQYFRDARYERTGSLLVLDYLSYPADAPVPTRMILRRD